MSSSTLLSSPLKRSGLAVKGKRRSHSFDAEHIAVRLENEDLAYKGTADAFDKALKPHVADKGYEWEFHVDETERRLWRVNGLIPPPFGSDVEQL